MTKKNKIVKERRHKSNRSAKIASRVIILCAIAAFLTLAVGKAVYNIFKERQTLKIVQLENEKLKKEVDEMQNMIEWLQSSEGVEGIARDNGMIARGEETIIFPPNDEVFISGENTPEPLPSYALPLILGGFIIIIGLPIVIIIYIRRRLRLRQQVSQDAVYDDIYLKK